MAMSETKTNDTPSAIAGVRLNEGVDAGGAPPLACRVSCAPLCTADTCRKPTQNSTTSPKAIVTSAGGSWGMITSSWAAQFIGVCERFGGQALAAPILEDFFAGGDDVARMQPRTHAVTMHGVTNLYQRRASCCRYYLLPQGNLCASCPLVSHDERLRRNREFMASQLAKGEKG